jgi:hypothetical protein
VELIWCISGAILKDSSAAPPEIICLNEEFREAESTAWAKISASEWLCSRTLTIRSHPFGFPNRLPAKVRLPGRHRFASLLHTYKKHFDINNLMIQESLARLLLYTCVDSFDSSVCLVRPPLKR